MVALQQGGLSATMASSACRAIPALTGAWPENRQRDSGRIALDTDKATARQGF
jgi:hypothetical protein